MPLADQGIISAGTFLFNVLLARAIPLGDYGHFAIILGILSLMQAGCASLIFYPLSIRGAATDEAGRQRLILSALIVTLMLCMPLAAFLGCTVWWFVDGSLLLPTFAILAAGQIQEAMRRGLLTDFRYGAAIPGDALSYFGRALLLVLVARHFGMTLHNALWIMAATSLLAAAVQAAQLALRNFRPLPLTPLVIDFWTIGHWSLSSNFLGIARTQCLIWLLMALTGPASVGVFQIVLNLLNVINPIVTGVCNAVPQAASRALRFGYRAAWSASWPLIGAGIPLVAGFAAILFLAPGETLSLVYGSRADPSMLVTPIRILAVGTLFYYAASTACAYLHGVLGGRDALIADGVSTLFMALTGPPLVIFYGLNGGCVALVLSFALRASVVGFFTITRVLQSEGAQTGTVVPPDHQETPA